MQLALVLDGDGPDAVVLSARPRLGFLHRGAEKLFEARDYRQVLALADRHDWLSGFASELGVALAVEELLGLELPPRAVWLRTLLAELTRALHALHFLPALPGTSGLPLHPARELLQGLLEQATGGRVHPSANRVGGLLEDVPRGWADRCARACDDVRPVLQAAASGVAQQPPGLGVLDRALCAPHGVTGPVARASGHDVDLRRDAPYLAYGSLEVVVPTGTAGDSRARALRARPRRARRAGPGAGLLRRAAARAGGGPAAAHREAAEGEVYAATEAPSGVSGYYLVSRGGKAPYRLAMRTASFANRRCCRRYCPAPGWATCPPCWAACSTSWATSTADAVSMSPAPGSAGAGLRSASSLSGAGSPVRTCSTSPR